MLLSQALQDEAMVTVQRVAIGSLLLYLCKPPLRSIDLGQMGYEVIDADFCYCLAPFAVDYIKRLV